MKIKFFCFIAIICGLNSAVAKPVLDIQHWQTKNNTPVYFVETAQLPILDARVIFAAGSSQDKNLYGIANLTAKMLDEGAGKFNANQIAEKFDALGTQFYIEVNRDMSVLGLRSLTKQNTLQPGIMLLQQIISNPTFPRKELSRLKAQVITSIIAQQQLPTRLATLSFYKNLYQNSPYAHSPIGVQTTVKSIKRKHILQFYRRYYNAQNAVIILVGKISAKTARQLADQLSAGLPPGKPAPILPESKKITHALNKNIYYPGTQSYVRIGCVGINLNNKNYFPVLVGNYILGGGILVSRLFNQVRQKNGLSYSVKSKFILLKNRGPFMILLQTKNSSKEKAIKIAKKVLTDFIDNGISAQELQNAKKFLIGSFALKRASQAKITNLLSIIAFYQLPINYLDTYQQNVNAVTKQQITNAFQQIIGKQKLVTVSVGE